MSAAGAGPELAGAVAAAARRAASLGRAQWVSLPLPVAPRDGLELFAASPASERFFWERPADGLQVVGLGASHAIELAGAQRFGAAAREARALARDRQRIAGAGTSADEPLLVGGFSFADESSSSGDWKGFPAGRLVLPELIVAKRGARAVCVATHRVDPGADATRELALARAAFERWCAAIASAPTAVAQAGAADAEAGYRAAVECTHAAFRDDVAAALRAISGGSLAKVVLARAVRVARRGGFDAAPILAKLRRAYPSCATFAVARPEGTFLGATPELLVRLDGRSLQTAATAGSAPRGRSPQEDERLGRELAGSAKERAEHALVVSSLAAALSGVCSELDVPDVPRLARLDGIQHLETPIRGALRAPEHVLELVGRLHPTPAVGGSPRAAALAWIARRERLERGWYAGPVGFARADGGGEFWVGLRSALLCGESARLFAGAGVVAGSQPEDELRETQLKLRAMLGALVEL